ncbi:3-hydroxyacyl-CoA dehydrogenase family protein [Melghirimyces algeriensis]|uniref:3-hydroxybutyryl-CoA dehydrogenase n=1 Tax=Melghirimyces algeriensis TaxID=910412 RepID=A0A521F7X0_9BACL|nr:3-hydroxyacyl-CoA dehydrogenase family protein [Melghirimyces algeriensis]SMO92279.1 3-hydroxybutyryl-CoA dehydrogenase [Melghirimyces algeriensis]
MKNKVLLVGEGPIVSDTMTFFQEKGVEVVTLEQADNAESDITAVVDVITGSVDHKREGLIQAVKMVPVDCPVFTSALYAGATRVASWLENPERVAGFSPLLLSSMDRVEISRPLQAEESLLWEQRVCWWKQWGKQVEILGDEPGLVFPRTIALMVNEAAYALREQIATAEDIDLAMKKGTNHPHGPLEWADRIGVDQVVWILKGLLEETGDPRYRPAPLLRQMVYAGRLGRSVGQGFYRYQREEKEPKP